MAFGNHYPAVVLLDNENNPITPLVDITSIYTNPQTKEDAQVLSAPIMERFYDVDYDSETEKFVDSDGDEISFIVGLKIVQDETDNKRKILVKKAKFADIAYLLSRTIIWSGLNDKDLVPLSDSTSESLEVRQY